MAAEAMFDAIVVGSGITGGLAAKELTEAGLKVLMLERGPMIEHGTGYKTETLAPWEMPFRGLGDAALYDSDYAGAAQEPALHRVHPEPFRQRSRQSVHHRARHRVQLVAQLQSRRPIADLGAAMLSLVATMTSAPTHATATAPTGRSATPMSRPGTTGSRSSSAWPAGRRACRSSPTAASSRRWRSTRSSCTPASEIGKRWPERRVTIGRNANLTEAKEGRGRLPAPLDLRAWLLLRRLFLHPELDASRGADNGQPDADHRRRGGGGRARSGDAAAPRACASSRPRTGKRKRATARVVFLNAGSFNSVGVLLRSTSEAAPNGLANSSGVLGTHIMDHATTLAGIAIMPGFEAHTYFGNRPTGVVIPRFRNMDTLDGAATRAASPTRAARSGRRGRAASARPGSAPTTRTRCVSRVRGGWCWSAFADSVPRATNRITLDPAKTDFDRPARAAHRLRARRRRNAPR